MTQTLGGRPARLPASYYQRDWVLACREETSFYSTPLAWDLQGTLDPVALTRALTELVRRHDALRTAFRVREGDVDQMVWRDVDTHLHQLDLSGSATPIADLEERIVAEAELPRVLSRPPLWHALLLRLAPRHHVLAVFIHHLIFDGWSHGVLHDELVRCYRAAVGGRAPRLPELAVQVGHFADWERSRRQPEAEQWWRDTLHELPPLSALPPVGGRFISAGLPEVPAATAAGLRALADRYGVGLNTVLLSTVVGVRQRVIGDDVVLGVVRAGRDRPQLHRVVGPLLDHVPVRVRVGAGLTVGGLLAKVDEAHRAATARALPLGLVRQVVAEDLSARGGRLFDTRYNYLPNAATKEATVDHAGASLRIAPRPIDPLRLAPRHTEDHPEVLPLSYILRRGPDGGLAGEVCGHDALYPAAVLRGVAEELADVWNRFATGGPDARLP
jgi:mycobactin peptide synthetase MbtE